MDKLVSIIVPVYNVEEYIEECIVSIINQTYKNLQIIVIDDGSVDKSIDICEKYAKNDSRIEIISQKNKGVSAARNTGLTHINGEFVTFIDSDDYVDSDYIETLLRHIDEDVDLVCCNVSNSNGLFNVDIRHKAQIAKLFSISGYTWGKLIRKGCVKENFHEAIKYAEDYIFYIDLMNNIDLVRVADYNGYHYRIRKGSLSVKDKEEKHTMKEFDNKYTFLKCNPWENVKDTSKETINTVKDHCYYVYTLLMLLAYKLKQEGTNPDKEKVKTIKSNMKITYKSFYRVTLLEEKNIKRFMLGTFMLIMPNIGAYIAGKLLK
ncbi:MAG: glycosyltransferase family 2 protein [Lachnospiraceae bacterium]|nr:glycosyltransferase family 2 protein [Lachnospiraceae bacterium]